MPSVYQACTEPIVVPDNHCQTQWHLSQTENSSLCALTPIKRHRRFLRAWKSNGLGAWKSNELGAWKPNAHCVSGAVAQWDARDEDHLEWLSGNRRIRGPLFGSEHCSLANSNKFKVSKRRISRIRFLTYERERERER